jgi:hypothetical protein
VVGALLDGAGDVPGASVVDGTDVLLTVVVVPEDSSLPHAATIVPSRTSASPAAPVGRRRTPPPGHGPCICCCAPSNMSNPFAVSSVDDLQELCRQEERPAQGADRRRSSTGRRLFPGGW